MSRVDGGPLVRAGARWCVYMLHCADGTLYTGVATDLARRVDEHNGLRARGARYTRARRPVKLVYSEGAANRSAACRREYCIKQMSRREKLELIRNTSHLEDNMAAKKTAKKSAGKQGESHAFKAIYEKDIPWQSDDVLGILTLPKGVRVKVLNYDPVMKRIDMKQRFPPGYVEPKHTHKSWHSILVTKGRMCVAGKDLRPGDYVFGWDIPHGPYEYPDGCEVFIVYMGDASHQWKSEDLLEHKNIWKPKTAAGKRGVKAHMERRVAGKE